MKITLSLNEINLLYEKKLITINENQNIKKNFTIFKFNQLKSLLINELHKNNMQIVTITKSGIAGPEISAIGKIYVSKRDIFFKLINIYF
tara:strand:- start:871 stop:1140 length:270 start_codon:yes stop_codon:yes gene_type:complete